MKISVILPCYDGAETIAVQLEALARQTWSGEWEIVVVNNGSTDGSMQIVEHHRPRLPHLRIVEAHDPSGPRRGVSHSYTVGFRAATGDAFLLCEADDAVGERWLATLADALTRHELVAAALEYERLNPAWMVGPGWQQQSADAGLSTISGPLFLPYASGSSLGLRRSVYERIGDPDQACGASWDTDYCWRAHLAGFRLHFVPETCVHYRLRPSFRSAYRQGHAWGNAHVVLANKYQPSTSRLRAVKQQARGVRDLAKHTARVVMAARSRRALHGWMWGLGWCIGELSGGL